MKYYKSTKVKKNALINITFPCFDSPRSKTSLNCCTCPKEGVYIEVYLFYPRKQPSYMKSRICVLNTSMRTECTCNKTCTNWVDVKVREAVLTEICRTLARVQLSSTCLVVRHKQQTAITPRQRGIRLASFIYFRVMTTLVIDISQKWVSFP